MNLHWRKHKVRIQILIFLTRRHCTVSYQNTPICHLNFWQKQIADWAPIVLCMITLADSIWPTNFYFFVSFDWHGLFHLLIATYSFCFLLQLWTHWRLDSSASWRPSVRLQLSLKTWIVLIDMDCFICCYLQFLFFFYFIYYFWCGNFIKFGPIEGWTLVLVDDFHSTTSIFKNDILIKLKNVFLLKRKNWI